MNTLQQRFEAGMKELRLILGVTIVIISIFVSNIWVMTTHGTFGKIK